jgi:ATP-dependent 26S proteasome regulatory subunit
MLDGLESKSVGRVCVMMTAMDVGNMPPALVRSGRIELWLEMSLPDAAARLSILADLVQKLPAELQSVELDEIVAVSSGFTGADLKRTVEDGKILYAHDRALGAKPRRMTEYFLDSAAETRRNKERYAAAEARASAVRSARAPWFTRVPHDEE